VLSVVLVILSGSMGALEADDRFAFRGGVVGDPAGRPLGSRVTFEMVGSRRDGPTGRPRSDTTDTLALGEEATRTLFAGAPARADLCEIGSLAKGEAREAFYVWDLHVRVIDVTAVETTLELDWQRLRPDGQDRAVGETGRIVSLEAGSPRVLDFVRPPDPGAECSNLVLQVRADPLPRPGRQPGLVYDVWLVAEGPDQNRSIHQSAEAPSGQSVSLRLDGLAWSPDGWFQEAAPTASDVTVAAAGTLIGTLAPDGSVTVVLRMSRTARWGATRVCGEARVEFRSGLGETLALALPTPVGRGVASTRSRAIGAAGGASESVGTTIDFARFFRGTRFSLYLRITQRGR
jgi:hypothetical protein